MKTENHQKTAIGFISFTNERQTYPSSICYDPSPSNCKLSYVDTLGSFLSCNNFTNEEKIEAINELMKANSNRNLYVTLIVKDQAEFIKANFECFYCLAIPCGYSNGDQYHILIKNSNYNRPCSKFIREDEVKPVEQKLTKDKVLEIITGAFDKTINRIKRLDLISAEIDKVINS